VTFEEALLILDIDRSSDEKAARRAYLPLVKKHSQKRLHPSTAVLQQWRSRMLPAAGYQPSVGRAAGHPPGPLESCAGTRGARGSLFVFTPEQPEDVHWRDLEPSHHGRRALRPPPRARGIPAVGAIRDLASEAAIAEGAT
jgi:hypothetical protein